MQSFVDNLTAAAAIAAALLAIFGAFGAVVNGLQKALTIPDVIRAHRFRPKHILMPTPDEVARFCVKELEATKSPTEVEWLEEHRGYLAAIQRVRERIARVRIRLMMMGAVFVYLVLVARLLFLGFLGE